MCPDAPVKLFVTASPEVRAARRLRELLERGAAPAGGLAAVLADLRERDARDAARAASPLAPADDAVAIDTSALGPEQALAAAVAAVERAYGPVAAAPAAG